MSTDEPGSTNMPKTNPTVGPDERIDEIDVSEEMKGSFLEYAYSVIYSRALPDARDGLKPVQRRILYQMDQMGLRPDRGHVKSSRVVGDVMGKLHPHGDATIYDTLVRLSQAFNQRVPLIDGHGNFGSLDDGPAAPRYTEARMAAAALSLTAQLDQDTVNFVPNYDNQYQQPEVLPAAFPNLLINGASGIAVGMATNIAPHNPGEALAAALHLLDNPQATTEDLMRFVPGPDFPGGGLINDLESIKQAYETGRGAFKVRAKVETERISARKTGLVITELPYMVGPERVMEKIKEAVTAGRLQGISNVTNLTDRHHGLRLVVDIKSGFNPHAVLAQLYKQTPLEETFAMNAVALVDGQPQLMTLQAMLQVFLDHRLIVTERRTRFQLKKKSNRLHLVAGLLIAILEIDEVIAIIRSSDDTAVALARLMTAFDLTETQANYILELRLRRLTKFSRVELEAEQSELMESIELLNAILASSERLAQEVTTDLLATAALLESPRRTVLLDGDSAIDAQIPILPSKNAAIPLEIANEPCVVILSAQGGLARIGGDEPPSLEPQADNSLWREYVVTTTRSQIAVVTQDGQAHRVDVVSLPSLLNSPSGLPLSASVPALDLIDSTSLPVTIFSLSDAPIFALGTERGVVKRVRPEHPENKDSWTIIGLEKGDRVIGGGIATTTVDLVFITAGTQLLRFESDRVRPQGLGAGGMAGIKLAQGDKAIFFAPVSATEDATVVTVAEQGGTLAGTAYTSIKITPLMLFPYKGRATQGVRCQRLLRGEDALGLAWAGDHAPRGAGAAGHPIDLPEFDERRDGSGGNLNQALTHLG